MNQTKELMQEYENIPKNSNTTMTREKLLAMINNITEMRENAVKQLKQ
jgi:hypothetical protein